MLTVRGLLLHCRNVERVRLWAWGLSKRVAGVFIRLFNPQVREAGSHVCTRVHWWCVCLLYRLDRSVVGNVAILSLNHSFECILHFAFRQDRAASSMSKLLPFGLIRRFHVLGWEIICVGFVGCLNHWGGDWSEVTSCLVFDLILCINLWSTVRIMRFLILSVRKVINKDNDLFCYFFSWSLYLLAWSFFLALNRVRRNSFPRSIDIKLIYRSLWQRWHIHLRESLTLKSCVRFNSLWAFLLAWAHVVTCQRKVIFARAILFILIWWCRIIWMRW